MTAALMCPSQNPTSEFQHCWTLVDEHLNDPVWKRKHFILSRRFRIIRAWSFRRFNGMAIRLNNRILGAVDRRKTVMLKAQFN